MQICARAFNMKRILILAIVAVIAVACGSGSSNDQGVAFTNLGFFSGALDGDKLPAGELGTIVPISGGIFVGEDGTQGGGVILTYIGLQNNLSGEFIRVDRLFMEYDIPGAKTAIPTTSVGIGGIVGPIKPVDATAGFSSSLPSSFAAENSPGNQLLLQFPVVPNAIVEFLNLNRNSLPELPFEMVVNVRATGVSSAGDRYDTNTASYVVLWQADNIVTPTTDQTGGDVSGTGTDNTGGA